MPDGLTFKIQGTADLIAQLDALGKLEDGKALRTAARAGLKPIVAQAKQTIPKSQGSARTYKGRIVGPGFASRNIRTISSLQPSRGVARASVGVRKEAYYAVTYVEKGTRKQRAQPWLENASKDTQDAQIDAVIASLQKSIDKAIKAK